jgi:hypothetical protein
VSIFNFSFLVQPLPTLKHSCPSGLALPKSMSSTSASTDRPCDLFQSRSTSRNYEFLLDLRMGHPSVAKHSTETQRRVCTSAVQLHTHLRPRWPNNNYGSCWAVMLCALLKTVAVRFLRNVGANLQIGLDATPQPRRLLSTHLVAVKTSHLVSTKRYHRKIVHFAAATCYPFALIRYIFWKSLEHANDTLCNPSTHVHAVWITKGFRCCAIETCDNQNDLNLNTSWYLGREGEGIAKRKTRLIISVLIVWLFGRWTNFLGVVSPPRRGAVGYCTLFLRQIFATVI